MDIANTRAHVFSPTTISNIPVENLQTPTPDVSDTDSAIGFSIPQSRKEKRKNKKLRYDSAHPTPSNSDTESIPPRKPPNNPPRTKTHTTIPPSLATMSKPAAQKAYPLLICSIGNPGTQYASTLHSAGHIVTSYIALRKNYKPFQKALSGLVAKPETAHLRFGGIFSGYSRVEGSAPEIDQDWTFWQSTSLMNVSGKGVQRAYTEWLRGIRQHYGDSGMEGRLVVVHDELEAALGKVSVRDGATSAKGHNGLKSCQASLGRAKWWRVGVGIGRPESREPDQVARYVLRKMTENERRGVENSAVGVADALEDIALGKK